ncbi:uncharacterized protein TrAtP1_002330 [Trichoderma atroviride]|uniref:uncharacterized protein n=1 Tax=Hypocrea atroviridis TaxID=63577 RepID=UPI0033189787|nr:hypothetical protein TrAtP1_002330 [Trichoderma atroviride]
MNGNRRGVYKRPQLAAQPGERIEVVLKRLERQAYLIKKAAGRWGVYERPELASRSPIKFNVTRNDNHIIQAIATVDFQDKGVNGFFMRLRECGYQLQRQFYIASSGETYHGRGGSSSGSSNLRHDVSESHIEDMLLLAFLLRLISRMEAQWESSIGNTQTQCLL